MCAGRKCKACQETRTWLLQVDLKKVVDHVCDTAGHLLKPRVTLDKMVDQTTPSIAGDGSRIVQVSMCLCALKLLVAYRICLPQ